MWYVPKSCVLAHLVKRSFIHKLLFGLAISEDPDSPAMWTINLYLWLRQGSRGQRDLEPDIISRS